FFFSLHDTSTTDIYPLSLHDALPIYSQQIQVLEGLEPVRKRPGMYIGGTGRDGLHHLIKEIADNSVDEAIAGHATDMWVTMLAEDRKSTRLNSSHSQISYAVFCLKKK